VTSFAVEYGAVEEILLPQLMASGVTNFLIIADERMASLGLQGGLSSPVGLGRDYTLWSPPVADGLFHPKIILQIGRDGGRAFVSSANVTGAGLAGNAEIGFEIECDRDSSADQAIIQSIWHYLDGIVPNEPSAARDALTWAIERADWLRGPATEAVQTREDGSLIAFLPGPGETGIGRRFAELVGEPVEHLIVVSPFWDGKLAALMTLRSELNPSRVSILMDSRSHDFPGLADGADQLEIIDVADPQSSRFIHAKLIIASTASHDHVLAGSANCTTAALGSLERPATNGEACLYRRLPRGSAIESLSNPRELNLSQWIQLDPTPLSQLPTKTPIADIPLKALEEHHPGSFEIDQGQLTWKRPKVLAANCFISLRDVVQSEIHQIPIGANLSELTPRFPLLKEIAAQTRFASIHCDGFQSAIAPVTHRAALRAKRREIATGTVAKALSQFSVEADFGLFMHQALEALFRADFDGETPVQMAASGPQVSSDQSDEPEHTTLTYDEFMIARPRQQHQHQHHPNENSFSGLNSDSVRGFLNNLVGVSSDSTHPARGDDDWMDTGDEPGVPSPPASAAPDQQPVGSTDEATGEKAVDPSAVVRAVVAYLRRLKDATHPVGPADVLRLRFWMMFLLYNARCAACPTGLRAASDDQSWPRAVVRIVSAFFVGRERPIARLMMSAEYVEMPADYLECWATIDWTLAAIEAAVANTPRNRGFLPFVPRLRLQVRTTLALTEHDVNAEAYQDIFRGMDERLGRRLGVAVGAR
jgi:hypothetical protein